MNQSMAVQDWWMDTMIFCKCTPIRILQRYTIHIHVETLFYILNVMQVIYTLANSIKKCHRTPTHNVLCNIVGVPWSNTPLGGSSDQESVLCPEKSSVKLGSQCVSKDTVDNDPVSFAAAQDVCQKITSHLHQPRNIYQSIVFGVYAEFREYPTFWIGLKKVGNIWVKPDGNQLKLEEEFWGPGEPSTGDCVIADRNIEYHHRAVDCSEHHQVLYHIIIG